MNSEAYIRDSVYFRKRMKGEEDSEKEDIYSNIDDMISDTLAADEDIKVENSKEEERSDTAKKVKSTKK